jgi:hypothetical protein
MGQDGSPRKQPDSSASAQGEVKPPLHPYWVLLIAILLPGVGQVINNTPKRGLMFVFFIMSLGWVTLHLSQPDASFVGRYAGGFLIYAISIADAYRWARYRWEFFHNQRQAGAAPAP